ncbi:unnamed protein product [Allacma fusca]|uniref:Uncharacterized protein n=1 Tax=Allacma fusca TaxID=39272 RepID=A0A8J2P0Q5_9HEXA|nr:unnamed protein product [Allacma fusca]
MLETFKYILAVSMVLVSVNLMFCKDSAVQLVEYKVRDEVVRGSCKYEEKREIKNGTITVRCNCIRAKVELCTWYALKPSTTPKPKAIYL